MISPEDFHKWYHNTFIYWKKEPVYVYDHGVDNLEPVAIVKTHNGSGAMLKYNSDKTWEPAIPESGLYNVHSVNSLEKKAVAHIYKPGHRQWKKSYCSHLYKFHDPINDYKQYIMKIYSSFEPKDKIKGYLNVITVGMNDLCLSLPFISSILSNPKYETVAEAYNKIQKGEIFAIAISLDFLMCPDINSNNIQLMYYHLPIGKVTSPNTIEVMDKVFVQELQDLGRRTGQFFLVKRAA